MPPGMSAIPASAACAVRLAENRAHRRRAGKRTVMLLGAVSGCLVRQKGGFGQPETWV